MSGIDARGLPTNTCPNCGNNWFNAIVAFEDGEVSAFIHEASCVGCDTLVTLADPIDIENRGM
jgi:hypothetical protein